MNDYVKIVISQAIVAIVIFVFLHFYGVSSEHKHNLELARTLNQLISTQIKKDAQRLEFLDIQDRMTEQVE